MPQPPALELLAKANQLRGLGLWKEAIAAYQRLEAAIPNGAEIQHNLAICWLGLDSAEKALNYANRAIHLKPDLWQSHLIKAKAERKLDASGAATAQTLKALLSKHSAEKDIQAHARLDLAELELNVFCNAKACAQWIKPCINTPGFEERARLTSLISKLYDRDETDEELTKLAITFAKDFLQQTTPAKSLQKSKTKPRSKSGKRKRIGLLSPMFHVGPLYFLTYESFKLLSETHDLIFFSRGKKEDWASEKFQAIAHEWIDCKSLSWSDLANTIENQELCALFELGGWMDTDGLKAVSTRPAPKQYKWVGGQAMTTGLTSFDGYLTDIWQTPKASETLFTEPLIMLPDGYVRYTPPEYFPKRRIKKLNHTAAIIGNPLKVTQLTAQNLAALLRSKAADTPQIKELRLIDRRYRHLDIKNRIEELFSDIPVKLSVIACDSHEDFLKEVAKVRYVVDTAPYSAGLTAREALGLGATLLTPRKPAQIFASRHGWAAKKAYESSLNTGAIKLIDFLDL